MFTKKNRVLLINHDVYQDDNQFPLGPAYLAAVLHEKGAYVEAYCMDVFHHTNEELAEYLDNNEYDIIGIGYMAARFKETVQELCQVINEHKKNAWLVLGGPGPSPIPEYSLRETGADAVAVGEAENTIIDLLDCKVNKKDLSKVAGIAFLDNGRFVKTIQNRVVRNLDKLPLPLWEIFPMERYTTCIKGYNQKEEEKSFFVISSRGCVNRCNFCYRMEAGIRLRSIKSVVEELSILYNKYGVNNIYFQDELFVVNKKRLLELENELNKARIKTKFWCNARADIMDEEMIEILKRCGCQFINFGFESSSDKVLKLMNKNVSVDDNIKALEAVKKVGGIGMGLNFIWNNFGDDEHTLWENVRLIKKYNTYYQCRTIKPTTPYPGADLYDTLVEKGKLGGPEDFFNKFRNSDLMLVNIMEMSDKEAYRLLLEANTDLIMDHYTHVDGDIDEAKTLIKNLADLYAGEEIKFRGVRHYKKDDK
ncbi:MAG: B12-binding domain-containing radical SAM protein [Nanoarchaeota archaeon]|nr:B12-binding domain-containing radical SAM protein [Nanoarchaeota archaeon]